MITVNLNGLNESIDRFTHDLKLQGFTRALKKGIKVYEVAYRRLLQSLACKPGKATFVNAFEAVESKVAILSDGSGAFAVVGTERVAGQRTAPQVYWDETGTKDRYTKSHAFRGKVLPQHWLDSVVAANETTAEKAVMDELSAYFANSRGSS